MTRPLAVHSRKTEIDGVPLTSVANHTKWEELLEAMRALIPIPEDCAIDLSGDFWSPRRGPSDRFRASDYETLRYVDIVPHDAEQAAIIARRLVEIGLVGERRDGGFRVYGYLLPGEQAARFSEVNP